VSVGEKNKFIEPKLAKNRLKKAIALKSYSELDQIQSIQNYMLHEKPFLQSDFQIIYMANYFKIPAHQCSSMVNNLIGKNFRDWVNSHRIEYFIKIYPEKFQKLTIDGIAFESGFSSMTTFYRVFKKHTGKIPLDYF
jgi:YesN/AraC family two-component response regulator